MIQSYEKKKKNSSRMRCKGYHVDASRANYETSQGGLKRAGLIFAEPDEPPPTFVWVDGILRKEDAIEHSPYQRFNKIPGMDYICYKSTLFKSLNEMRKSYPALYDVYPRTFLLPREFLDFQREHKSICGRSKQAPSWVVKPKNSCCGRGISIIQSVAEAQAIDYDAVIQQYITPFLIDGHKFDFRLYLLIASLQPLAIFIYKEGIARFCTQIFEFPSKANRDKKFIHLTNTAINIENSKEPPSKFTKLASEVFETISKRYRKSDQLWEKICEACRAVIIGIYGSILNNLPKKCDEKSAEQKRCDMIHKNKKAFYQKYHLNDMPSDDNNEKVQINVNENPVNNTNSPIIPNSNILPENKFSSTQNQKQEFTNRNQNPLQNSLIIQNNLITSSRKKPKITRPNVGEASSKLSNPTVISPIIHQNPNQRSQSIPHDYLIQDSSSTNSLPKQSFSENSESNIENDSEINENDNKKENENKETNSNENKNSNENENKETNLNEIENENKEINSNENKKVVHDASHPSTDPLPLRKRFFHILGIDIMIDSDMNPKVLELNDRPSLGVTVDFELELKEKLIAEAYEHVSPNGDWYGNNENSGWIQIYPLPREEAAKSPYPIIVNNFLNPSRGANDPQKLPSIQFPKRSVPDFLHNRDQSQKKKKKKKTRRESK